MGPRVRPLLRPHLGRHGEVVAKLESATQPGLLFPLRHGCRLLAVIEPGAGWFHCADSEARIHSVSDLCARIWAPRHH